MSYMTSVSVVCRSRPFLAALTHVVLSLEAYLDPSRDWDISDAVKFGSVRLLDRIAARVDALGAENNENRDTNSGKQHGFQVSISIAMSMGFLDVVQWLVRRFPKCKVPSNAVANAAKFGHLSVLQWLFHHHNHVYWGGDEMYNAVAFNHLEVAKFLNEYTAPPPNEMYLIDAASRHGDLKMMQWLHQERGDQLTYEGVMRVVDLGFVDVVQWMVETFPNSVKPKTLRMDNAAANGHLEMVRWLHEQGAWCTKQAMNRAAANGRLDVVKFLHKNRSEGCTTDAIDSAAKKGFFDVVNWLHEHQQKGSSGRVIADAGHVEIR